MEKEEYKGLDWRREVGELRAEAIEAEQGSGVQVEELKKVLEEFKEEDKEEEEEEEEEDEEEDEDGEDDSRDGYLEGGRDLEVMSLSGKE